MHFLKTSSGSHFKEHHGWYFPEDTVSEKDLPIIPEPIHFLKKNDYICFEVCKVSRAVQTSYFVGVDWINKEKAICVEPKLNDSTQQVDYFKILFTLFQHPEICLFTNDLCEIKLHLPYILITQQQDLLTPLLTVQFLSLLKEIVKKGLKKSYYKVEGNLYAKVKGKVMVGQTIKQNVLKYKALNTFCSYQEFGINGLENRLLKKAFILLKRYTFNISALDKENFIEKTINYIDPVFDLLSEEVSLDEVKHATFNAFHKEYEVAIRLAKLIIRRFGYNIIDNNNQLIVKTPPFWIDMSKLFELYVYSLLRERFKKPDEINYLYSSNGNILDFLVKSDNYKMVVDAKYKVKYKHGFLNEDIRQVSGYARLKSAYAYLEKPANVVIDCLIVYPDQEKGLEDLKNVDFVAPEHGIEEFLQIFKVSVKLPMIKYS